MCLVPSYYRLKKVAVDPYRDVCCYLAGVWFTSQVNKCVTVSDALAWLGVGDLRLNSDARDKRAAMDRGLRLGLGY